ncbi:MAG TPA: Ig-like domain-containing protein [Clostridiales bacterium]|nr:Ig-like domain-containing protein [Clostridiales bacterium]
MIKIRDLFRNKAAITVTAAVLLLAAAVVTAALTGLFGGTGKSTGDKDKGAGLPDGSHADTVRYAELLDSIVEISAADQDSLGVSTTSSFRLLFSRDTDEKAIASSLSVEPKQDFSLTRVSAKEFSLEFSEPMESNKIYTFTLNDRDNGAKKSWAFQTKKQLSVVRTLPRDRAIYVPVNSGIEITFSHSDIENAEECFEISPKVNGSFQWNKKTLVFVPENLEYDTIYTVTIRKGVRAKGSEETLQSDYTFKFQTERPPTTKTYFDFAEDYYNFLPGTVPALEVYTMWDISGKEVPVELYSFPDAESFMNALRKAHSRPYWAVRDDSEDYGVNALEKTASMNCSITRRNTDNHWSRSYLVLPSSLQEGYYLVAVDIDGDKYYVPMQINSTSVYIMTAGNKYLAWLNDAATGQPMSGAVFRHESGASAVSDSNGLAMFDSPGNMTDTGYELFLIEPKSKLPFVACVRNNYSAYHWNGNYYGSYVTDIYWTYMYTDRSVYLPRDTVNVWGVIKPRDGAAIGSEAVLELIGYKWTVPATGETPAITSQKITLSPEGTFTGSLKISNFDPGGYTVRVRMGDDVLVSRYISVEEYTKPVYTIEAKPDFNYMFAWETVNFDITSSFFEGTPASGMKLDHSTLIDYKTFDSGVLTCDDNGKASVSVRPLTDEKSWRPQVLEFSLVNSDAEEQQVRESQRVYVFPRDTMIEVSSKAEGSKGTVSFATSMIDISGLKAGGSGYPGVDDYRGKSVDMPVKAKLYEIYYVAEKTGYYYDHINKVRRDTYTYRQVEDLVSEYSFTTVDGKYEIQYPYDRTKSYKLVIYASDSQGRPIEVTEYLYNWDAFDPYNEKKYVLSQSDYYKPYRTGETVRAEVRYNDDEQFEGKNRRYLFVRMRNGIVDCTVSENAVYEFPFESSFIPNIYVKALCFDGAGIYDAGMNLYRYDFNEKKLDISITPDRQSYKPGDEVRLSVDVKDASGNPAAAEVNISVVDEAYFALYGQSADILGELYGICINSGLISEYLSYKPLPENESPGAEMGGEGGDSSIRKDFRDTALFTTVRTGEDGKAEVTFRLPDNLTSWRITCQAVTGDLRAGTRTANVSAKLPFFVDSIFNKSFITGDSPSILVRANGEELPVGAEVDFRVTLIPENGTARTFTAKGTARLNTEIQLGSLDAGNYTVRIEGTYGSRRDAMERSFRVSDSLLETSVTDFIPLTDGISLATDAKGLTTLTIFNEDSWVLYNELHSLYWQNWGRRLDQVLARKIAVKLLKNYFNEDVYYEEEFDLQHYQTYDGGLALLTYDSSSPELSARMCSLAADSVDRNGLASYFYGLIENANTVTEDVIYAYWGLAALKEPVLLDIRSLLASEGLDMKTRLALGVALAEAGDHKGAAQIYSEYMSSVATVTETYAWLEAGSRDDSIDATALCALIAMKINAPEKMKLFRYISSNSTSMLLVNMERMIFVTNHIKDANLTGSFTYELDGVKKTVELKKGSFFRLILTPEKLASIKFSNINGRIVAARSYTMPVSESMRSAGNLVSISRTYETPGKDGPGTAFDRSDTVKVTLTLRFGENAPDGYYEVTDVLPAGLRYTHAWYIDKDTRGNAMWHYPYEVTGQKVVFGCYYNRNYNHRAYSITYFAKAVSPGTYTADSAAVRHTDSDIAGFTQTERITIKK